RRALVLFRRDRIDEYIDSDDTNPPPRWYRGALVGHSKAALRGGSRRVLTTMVSVGIVAMVGCGDGSAEPGGYVQFRIYNGTVDSANDCPYAVFVHFLNPSGNGMACSGVLVTPAYVVTARHCILGTSREGAECLASQCGSIPKAVGASDGLSKDFEVR